MTKRAKFEPAMVNLMTRCEAALAYADQGWHVSPCEGPDRPHPAFALFGEPTIDKRIIQKWFTQFPDANIRIATGSISGLWIVEICGGSMEEKQAEAGKVSDLLPIMAKAIRPGNYNIQLYVGIPASKMEQRISNKPGISIIGDGSWVLAPPSKLSMREYVAFWGNGQ